MQQDLAKRTNLLHSHGYFRLHSTSGCVDDAHGHSALLVVEAVQFLGLLLHDMEIHLKEPLADLMAVQG